MIPHLNTQFSSITLFEKKIQQRGRLAKCLENYGGKHFHMVLSRLGSKLHILRFISEFEGSIEFLNLYALTHV